jgi:hypothetical protein
MIHGASVLSGPGPGLMDVGCVSRKLPETDHTPLPHNCDNSHAQAVIATTDDALPSRSTQSSGDKL